MICDKKLLCWRRKGRIKCSKIISRITYLLPILKLKNNFLSSFSVSLPLGDLRNQWSESETQSKRTLRVFHQHDLSIAKMVEGMYALHNQLNLTLKNRDQRLSQCLNFSGLKYVPGWMFTFFWGEKQPAWGSDQSIVHSWSLCENFLERQWMTPLYLRSLPYTVSCKDVIFSWSYYFILFPLHTEIFRKICCFQSAQPWKGPAIITEYWSEG